MGFDHACRAVGVRIVDVDTVQDLKAAINPKTAMLFWVNISEPKGKISAKEFLEAGKSAGCTGLQRCGCGIAASRKSELCW